MSESENTQIETITPEQQERDIRDRVDNVVDQVSKFYDKYQDTRKQVKTQLEEIVDIGIKRYGMKPSRLRDIIDTSFAEKHISLSYLRKLLPDFLKMTSRTNKRYLEGPKSEESDEDEDDDDDTNITDITDQKQTGILGEVKEIPRKVADYIDKQKQEIKTLRGRVKTLRTTREEREDDPRLEIFTARAIVEVHGSQIPIVSTIDPRKQMIVTIETDETAMKRLIQSNMKAKKK